MELLPIYSVDFVNLCISNSLFPNLCLQEMEQPLQRGLVGVVRQAVLASVVELTVEWQLFEVGLVPGAAAEDPFPRTV